MESTTSMTIRSWRPLSMKIRVKSLLGSKSKGGSLIDTEVQSECQLPRRISSIDRSRDLIWATSSANLRCQTLAERLSHRRKEVLRCPSSRLWLTLPLSWLISRWVTWIRRLPSQVDTTSTTNKSSPSFWTSWRSTHHSLISEICPWPPTP